MRCLMCDKELGESSFRDILFGEDELCQECRETWLKVPQHFSIEGIRGDSDYLYQGGFSSCLIQYKECGDEALKNVFLSAVKKKLQKRYHGMTLCLMPSSSEKIQERGFSHLEQMFAGLGLKMLDPFMKKENRVQKEMNYAERQLVKEQIVLKENIFLPKKIVLCDDVITTGSTIKGALHCIRSKGYQVVIYSCAMNNREKVYQHGEEWQ